MTASEFLLKEQQEAILSAIGQAEKETSGEIRVHLELKCKGEILDCAADTFSRLGMHKTRERNGVLIYIAIENRQFAIIGDAGINSKVPQGFWDQTQSLMAGYFKKGDFAGGIVQGIESAGKHLKQYFPCAKDDVNELKNDISYGK